MKRAAPKSGSKTAARFGVVWRLLAVLALLLQSSVQSIALASDGGALASLICAPSGALSAEARAAADELRDLIDSEAPQSDVPHCPLCALVHGAPLPAPSGVAEPGLSLGEAVRLVWSDRPHPAPFHPHKPARAPPTSLS